MTYRETGLTELKGVWTKRFMAAAIVQGAVVAGLTVFLVLGQASFMKPEVSRVMAAGGAIAGFVYWMIAGREAKMKEAVMAGDPVSEVMGRDYETMLKSDYEEIGTQIVDAIAAVPPAECAQASLDAWNTVSGPALLVEVADVHFELLILLLPCSGLALALLPVVIAAFGDFKSLAEQRDGMLIFHGFDPLEALLGGSERMPKVFFRMSRCCRRWRFSRSSSARRTRIASRFSGCWASCGWRRCFQSRNCQGGSPNSRAIWASGRPLVFNSWTACFLNSRSWSVRFGLGFVDMADFLSQFLRPLSTLSGEAHHWKPQQS